jgi:DNA invertase Pin-like site-specific DNA recombinase
MGKQTRPAARSVADQPAIVARLETMKVSLRVLSVSGNQPLDTSTATDRLMLAVIRAIGQAEREALLERQRGGIAKAKREGRYKGRVPTARRQSAEIPGCARMVSGPRKSPAGWGSQGERVSGSGTRGRMPVPGENRHHCTQPKL